MREGVLKCNNANNAGQSIALLTRMSQDWTCIGICSQISWGVCILPIYAVYISRVEQIQQHKYLADANCLVYYIIYDNFKNVYCTFSICYHPNEISGSR